MEKHVPLSKVISSLSASQTLPRNVGYSSLVSKKELKKAKGIVFNQDKSQFAVLWIG
jgi:hypothetical protein